MGLLGYVSKAEINRMWGSTFKVRNKAYLAKRICYVGLFMFMYGSQKCIFLILFTPIQNLAFPLFAIILNIQKFGVFLIIFENSCFITQFSSVAKHCLTVLGKKGLFLNVLHLMTLPRNLVRQLDDNYS